MATSLLVCVGQQQPWRFQEKMSKQRREGGRRRGRQTMSKGPWLRRFGSTDHPNSGGGGVLGGGLSPLSVPQSQIHSWYPPQKRWQWLASIQPSPHPPPYSYNHTSQSCPSTWLRPSQCDLPPPPQQRGFPRTQPAFTTTENTPRALSNASINVCLWNGRQMLVLRADAPLFLTGVEEYLMPALPQHLCSEEKGESSVN